MKEKINSCKDKSILSDRICKLIKEKEQKLNQEKQFQEIRMEKRGNIENIKRIIEIIYIYYVHRRVSNIFYASIIEHICEQESINLTKSDVVSIVDNLAVDFSYWISLVKNKKGQILQINKSVPLQRMFQELSA